MTLFLLYLFKRVYLHILIYIILMPFNLSQYWRTVGTFNNRYLIHFRNSYQHFKYYLNDNNIAFGVIPFSCSILTTISIFFLLLSFRIFVCNTIKIFLFSRLKKITGMFVSIFVFTVLFLFFFLQKLLLKSSSHSPKKKFYLFQW